MLVPGIGNDGAIVGLWDAGWQSVTAFDYSEDAVTRARTLFGDRKIKLLSADSTSLPFANDSFDAVLDKGVMDAINIVGMWGLVIPFSNILRPILLSPIPFLAVPEYILH